MAGKLEHPIVCQDQAVLGAPGTGVERRIVDLELIEQFLRTNPGEPLRDAGLRSDRKPRVRHSANTVVRAEAGAFDYQSVAFPTRIGLSFPGGDAGALHTFS